MVLSVCVPTSVGVLLQEFKVYMACNFLCDLTYDQFRAICSPGSIVLQSKQLPSLTIIYLQYSPASSGDVH